MSRRRVPRHRSLVTRLLVTAILITLLAVATTAWLATRTATQAIRQAQGRSLTDEKVLYDALIGYAATHRDWSGVSPLLSEQARKLRQRITLTDDDRRVLAESSPGPSLASANPSATVDPLDLDLTLTGGTSTIDARVVGPYRLTRAESHQSYLEAVSVLRCLPETGNPGKIVTSRNGRSLPESKGSPEELAACRNRFPSTVTQTEAQALRKLGRLVSSCLGVSPRSPVTVPRITTAASVVTDQKNWYSGPTTAEGRTCLQEARRKQLRPYAAPAVQLFVTDPDTGLTGTAFVLSRDNVRRIVGVTGGVLLFVVLITVLLGRQMVRRLHTLTEGAAGPGPIVISSRDEFGYLAEALNQARARRDRAEALRRAMVGDVAHELRNPITTMRGWLEAAQDGLADTDRQLVDLLHDETMHLHHIIDDLADLAAADAGTLRMHTETVDLPDLLAQVLEVHRNAAETAGVTLSVRTHGETELTADPVRLRQLIGNLVSNGIRYTPRGGRVTLHSACEHDVMTLTVTDTGIGIAPDNLSRVFDRFWRADESRTRASGGSGLGLAVARQITDLHHGTITVDSTPGRGTTFSVRIPMHREVALHNSFTAPADDR